jgi:hypothetical protein
MKDCLLCFIGAATYLSGIGYLKNILPLEVLYCSMFLLSLKDVYWCHPSYINVKFLLQVIIFAFIPLHASNIGLPLADQITMSFHNCQNLVFVNWWLLLIITCILFCSPICFLHMQMFPWVKFSCSYFSYPHFLGLCCLLPVSNIEINNAIFLII